MATQETVDCRNFCIETKYLSITRGPHRYHAKAKQKIRCGTIITRNKPMASILSGSFRGDEYCSFCYTKPKQLKACSRCKSVGYCGRTCQVGDFPFHKFECKHIFGAKSQRFSRDEQDEMSLMCRIFAALDQTQNSKTCKCDTYDSNGVGLVECGCNHWEQMAMAPKIELIKPSMLSRLLKIITSSSEEDLVDALKRFQANNFGIINDLQFTIGQGVYPHGAILNHSCDPNCFLRYRGNVMEIVALQDINHGDELTHSYVDLAKDTDTRRRHFQELHGFDCSCARCKGELTVRLPKKSMTTPDKHGRKSFLRLYEWILQTKNPHHPTSDSDIECIELNVDAACKSYLVENPSEITRAMQECNALKMRMKEFQGIPTGELLRTLSEAVAALEARLSPFSVEIYKERGELLSETMAELGGPHCGASVQSCYEQCLAITAFLVVVFPAYHPMLGLQLYTLADLAKGGDPIERKRLYQWTRDIMCVSHGPQHFFIQGIDEIVSEL